MSKWTGLPCADCNKKKGAKQADDMRCWTCARVKKQAQSQAAHGKRVEANYGISEKDYWALYEFQGGRCALCAWAKGKSKRLAVDHYHGCTAGHDPKVGCPECVRGLLCTFCNRLLGRARDSIAFFERCISYLRNPPWRQLQQSRSRKVS